MARSRIVTGLEKLMSDLPKLMIQRSLAEDSQMKKLSMQATEGYLKEAANFTSVAQFDSAAASMMDELGQHGNDPTIAMAGNNAFKAMGRLRQNFVNKQEAVVNFNTSFAKAKELKLEDTTSGMQELYSSVLTTFEAKKQYFNSTEYSGYQKQIEQLGEDIKTKSMFNYLDDLALGETDEKGNIIVAPGIQSGATGLKNLYEMNKIGAINNRDTMKELFDISKDINAGTVGAIMNFGTKDMRLMDRELKDFNYKELDASYQSALTSDFSALQFNEKEVTPENISYVRGTIGENVTNLLDTGFIKLPKKKNGKSYADSISGFENFILDELKANPNKPIYEILEDRVDTWGFGLKPGDPDTKTARNQRLHFSKMVDLYMKTGSIMGQVDKARNNSDIDSSISSYTNRLLNYAIDEQQPTAPIATPGSVPSTTPVAAQPAKTSTSMSSGPSPFIQSNQVPIGVLAPSPITGGTAAGKQTKQGQSVIKGQSNILDLVKTITDSKRAKEFAKIPESEFGQVRTAPTSNKGPGIRTRPTGMDVTDIVANISPAPTSKPTTTPKVASKPLPSLGKALAQDKSPAGIAKRKEADRVADIRVPIKSQSVDQDDASYLSSIDSKQLKKIGVWSDKNVTSKLKSSAKKELKSAISELQGMRGDADAARVAKELPKLRKLLKEFNSAGVNTISKGMLEYMYTLNASQYEGVDDFLASLSDGKIGVE